MTRILLSVLAALILTQDLVAQERSVPGPRAGHAAAYHPGLGMVLVFAGRTSHGRETNDLWGWDGSRWHEIDHGSDGPSPRSRHVMAYDPARGRLVIQGGGTVERDLEDTWSWEPEGWTRVEGEGPGPRSHHQIAYDPGSQEVLLYGGGRDEQGFGSDLWSLGASGWNELDLPLRPGRVLGRMVSTDSAVLLFGGLIRGGPRSRELWQWKHGAWSLLEQRGPEGRIAPGLAWFRSRGEVVLFGGETTDGLCGGTWIWTGSEWRSHMVESAPTPRTEHTLVYDEARDIVVLFGGRTAEGVSDELWEWDGEQWWQRLP